MVDGKFNSANPEICGAGCGRMRREIFDEKLKGKFHGLDLENNKIICGGYLVLTYGIW
jgi:hypothetical protein